MKQEEFSGKLMDKLSGELSENEAILFHECVSNDPELSDDFAFFNEAWNSLGDVYADFSPSEDLSNSFYEKLEMLEEKEKESLRHKLTTVMSQYNVGTVAQTVSFAAVLVFVGFFLGGVYNANPNLSANHKEQAQIATPSELEFYKTTDKLDYVQSINNQNAHQKETFNQLKSLIANETNTNVRLAALNKLNQYYSNEPELKQFLASQFEVEQSTLIQVELLNLMIDNYHTGETIKRMETILVKNQNLNPFVQEKIKKDLPVLRASFVQ